MRARDIIVIDEISMLSAGALHGIDAALNFVMRTDLTFDHSVRSTHFGGKSLVACVAPLFLRTGATGGSEAASEAARQVQALHRAAVSIRNVGVRKQHGPVALRCEKHKR